MPGTMIPADIPALASRSHDLAGTTAVHEERKTNSNGDAGGSGRLHKQEKASAAEQRRYAMAFSATNLGVSVPQLGDVAVWASPTWILR